MGLSSSCTQRAAETRTVAPSSQPIAEASSKPLTPDVAFYSLSRRHPQTLKEDEKQLIIQTARQMDSQREVWCITSGSHWGHRVEVYYLPDEIRGQARRGKALAFRYRTIFDAYRDVKSPDMNVEVFDYVQVGEEPPEKFKPRPQNLPFETPAGLTFEEVAEIITRVQSDKQLPDDGSFPRQVDHRYPVLRFEIEGDKLEVWTGFQEGPLNGGGEVIQFRKENGKWMLKSIGMWVS
jgi:hypothetical protein